MKKKALLSSILTIVLCLSLIAGSTFALFTSQSEVNVAVTSGTVNVVATASDLTLYSMGVEQKDGRFENGGTAKLEGNTVTLDKMTPGDAASFTMTVENKSDVTIVYRTIVDCIKDTGLFAGLNVTIADEAFDGFAITEWESLEAGKSVDKASFNVTVELPVDAGNDYQGKEATLCYAVEAVQGNGEPKTTALTQDDNGVYQISDMYDLKVFSSMVNSGAATFANAATTYDAVLTANIDLKGTAFLPIGTAENPFLGSFDGQGFTVENFTVHVADGAGLFGYVGSGNVKVDNSITNVKVNNATVSGTHYAAAIAAKVWGNVTDCTVTNTTVTVTPDGTEGKYDNGDKAGAIAGWANISQLTGNTVDNVTISAYRDLGAIVGCINHEALSGTSNVSGNIVTNTTVLYDNSGKTYGDAQANANAIAGRVLSTMVVVGGNEYTVSVAGVVMTSDVNVITEDENLQELVKKGGTLVLQSDRTETSAKGGYSVAGLAPAAGSVLDGNGNELWVNGANGTWDCAIYATGGTIKNLTVGGSFRGIFSAGTSADIVIDNVTIDNVCYTFNSDNGNKAYGVYISNSTLNGWTSYSNVHKEVVFTNCNFGKGTGGYQYAYMRPYAPTILKDCVFEEGFEFDATRNSVFFVNCYVGNTLITADNVVSLLGADAANAKFPVTGETQGLKEALTAGSSYVYLADGNYELPAISNGAVTIAGTTDTVITVDKPAMHGTDVTFNGVTIQGKGTYTGVQHVKTVTYNNAVIKGSMCLYGDKVVFNNCTFESTDYLWTYGATEVVLNNCTFNTAGKAILVYNEEGASAALNTVTVNNCTFNATEAGQTSSGDHCAAVEIGSGCPFTVNFTGTNVVDEDFAGLWRDKATTSANAVTVTVDGTTVYTR